MRARLALFLLPAALFLTAAEAEKPAPPAAAAEKPAPPAAAQPAPPAAAQPAPPAAAEKPAPPPAPVVAPPPAAPAAPAPAPAAEAPAAPAKKKEEPAKSAADKPADWLTSGELALLPRPPEGEPAEGDRLIFSHKFHRVKAKADCVDCHQPVADSETAAGSMKPKEAVCFDGCHDPESERPNCGFCHTDAKNPSVTFPQATTELAFNHKAHLARPDVTCVTCHADAPASTTSTERLVPEMEVCEKCHERDLDRIACKLCHTQLPELHAKPKWEAVHKAGFFPLHGAWAVGSSALCTECHEQRFCADCHARTNAVTPPVAHPGEVARSFIHRGDFIGRHALESAARPASCQTCHGQSFCQDCHERSRNSFTGSTVQGRRSPHPAQYVRRGGQAFHGTDARMNIQSCAACHDQGAASNCVDCHKVGGAGGNPHPPLWKRRGRGEEKGSSSACIPCHGGG